MPSERTIREEVGNVSQFIVDSVSGDLVIEGGGDELMVIGDEAELQRGPDAYRLACHGDCRVRLPSSMHVTLREIMGDLRVSDLTTPLIIESAHSDAVIRNISGPVTIDHIGADGRITDVNGPLAIDDVGADLALRDINGPVAIDNIGSDLEAKRINGPFAIDNIGSDATLREVSGNVTIDNVGSDAVLSEVTGFCSIGNVGSDIVLDLKFEGNIRYDIGQVGSNVVAKVRPGSRVRFVIPAETEKSINMRGIRLETDDEQTTIIVGEAGEGDSIVSVGQIGGDFELVSQGRGVSAGFEFNIPDNLGDIISSQINEQLSRMEQAFSRSSTQAGERTDRLRERAERMAQKAREQAERMAEQSREKSKRRRKGFSMSFDFRTPKPPPPPRAPMPPAPPVPSASPVQPVTEQERLAVLRMVENKQITIEEAERLLAALEGRE
jgi:hypothetical protein